MSRPLSSVATVALSLRMEAPLDGFTVVEARRIAGVKEMKAFQL
jgi:hypothetical protein